MKAQDSSGGERMYGFVGSEQQAREHLKALSIEARKYIAAGNRLTLLANRGGDFKTPLMKGWNDAEIPNWTHATLTEQLQWSHNRGWEITGIGIINGSMSNGRIVFDFDSNQAGFYERVRQAVLEATGFDLDTATIVRRNAATERRHIVLRTDAPPQSTVLAFHFNDGKATTAVELKATGTYAVVPPSLHKSGSRYQVIGGDIYTPPLIAASLLDQIIAIIKTFNEKPEPERKPRQSQRRIPATAGIDGDNRKGLSVIQRFNAENSIDDMLHRYGYIHTGGDNYKHPHNGENDNSVGILSDGTKDRSYHRSPNDPYVQRTGEQSADAFDLYECFEHGGNRTAALRALGIQYGTHVDMTTKADSASVEQWTKAESADPAIRKMLEDAPAEPEPQTVTAAVSYPTTDTGNAELFEATYGKDVKHVTPRNKWYVWDGTRWQEDSTDQIRRLAIRIPRYVMPQNAKSIADVAKRDSYLKHAKASQSCAKIDAMLKLAKSEAAIAPAALDSHQWLMNSANGTIDLRTGELLPHSREHLLTKIAPAAFDSEADAPTWLAFVNRIFQTADNEDRQDLVRYVQKAIGYSMTGDTSEQCIFILNGCGNNGKSTFLNVVKHVMGDYAIAAQQQLLLSHREKSNSEDTAELCGVRLVTCSEINEGQRFNESTVKALTGSGRIKAMRKYEHGFEFAPTHKIWMDCNHMPQIHGTDLGIKRRLKRIPFDVTITADERDGSLESKLIAEASGILNWMLEGVKLWQREGLKEPASVAVATSEYFTDNDLLGQFLADNTVDNPAGKVVTGSLYDRYLSWVELNNLSYPLTGIAFGRKLKERGYQSKATNGKRYTLGVELTRTFNPSTSYVEPELTPEPYSGDWLQ